MTLKDLTLDSANDLRNRVQTSSAELRQLTKPKDKADTKTAHALEAQEAATRAWDEATQMRGAFAERLATRVCTASAGWDFARLAYQADEYRAKLAAPGNESGIDRANRLYDEARQVNDAHALRALRLAASELLAKQGGESPETAASLQTKMREDEQHSPQIRALKVELAEADRAIGDLREAIVQTAISLTGSSEAWAQSVLREGV